MVLFHGESLVVPLSAKQHPSLPCQFGNPGAMAAEAAGAGSGKLGLSSRESNAMTVRLPGGAVSTIHILEAFPSTQQSPLQRPLF